MAGLQLTKIVSRGRLITVELTSKPRNKPTQMSTAPLASMSVKSCLLVFLQTLASRPDWQCPADARGCTDEDDLSQ